MDTTGIKFIDELELEDKRVLIRVDFNVPMDEEGNITDDTRIRSALPTITYALEKGAKVILCSHFGRPKGKPVDSMSLEPVAARLAELLDTDTLLYDVEVLFPEDCIGQDVEDLIAELKPKKQVMLLENLRFHPGEEKGDDEFAKALAGLADIYVNDAFGAAHRAHASVYGINKFFDRHHKAAGLLMRSELKGLGTLLGRPKRPFLAILGGAKVSDKLGILESLLERVDEVLIGGAMAYTFMKANGVDVGNSRIEEEMVEQAQHIMTKAKSRDVRIHLPLDHKVAEKFEATSAQVTEGEPVPPGTMGLDIGPKTIEDYEEAISRAQTVFWNGPMGVFEREAFAEGTMSIARAVAKAKGFTVVGGGDSVSAVQVAEVTEQIDHVSTGGGASLELLEGQSLPGIESLRANHPFD